MLGTLIKKLKTTNTQESCKSAPLIEQIEKYARTNEQFIYEHTALSLKECEAYAQLKKLPDTDKIEAFLYLAERVNSLQNHKYHKKNQSYSKNYYIAGNLLTSLLRTKFNFPVSFSFQHVFELFYDKQPILKKLNLLNSRPFTGLVAQIEKHVKKHGLTDSLQADIEYILSSERMKMFLSNCSLYDGFGPDIGKSVKKLQQLLAQNNEQVQFMQYALGTGKCGLLIQADIDKMPENDQIKWHKLFHHLCTATAGKPTKQFLETSKKLIDDISPSKFKLTSNKWLTSIASFKVESQMKSYSAGYSYETEELFEAYSNNLLKGLLWSMRRFHDQQSLQNIATLTEKCFQKIPGIGPAAMAVGNAGLYTLAQSKGIAGISHLSRLKLRIKQNNTQKLIQKYIEAQAKKQGIKAAEVEQMAAPDFSLKNGQHIEKFDDYKLIVKMTGVGKSELQWLKPGGKTQKTVPSFVKAKPHLAEKLKKMRDLAKQIKQASTAQRDRIDRLYTEEIKWDYEAFDKYYLHHDLIGQIANKLIWNIDGQALIYVDEQWQNAQGDVVILPPNCQIHLWHPIESSAEQVLAWRERLESLKIQQPLKQAFREIYLLTDAEINTRIYSNRMAAHILKQHQFNSLAATRGWKYSLLGAYDDGRDGEIAEKQLPELKLSAQFWINEIIDDVDSFNDAGIWDYVATDQVRFCNEAGEVVPLLEIPALILSEVMRDVDLFVGVASVGNDPQWQDGGPEGRQDYRDYWHSYSFGDLTEVAKTRKTVLERLLPRLKIRDIAEIEGKFLLLQGKLHKYKIHIGSGNILIAPNDRYLCIVPGRGKDKNLNQVFLPFEGDSGLSIVLSKAFLLAEDDKITDVTITSQLKAN